MRKIFILNGKAGSGKDEFIKQYTKLTQTESINHSSIDTIKECALYLGWDGIKTPSGRKLLKDLKELSVWYNDLPFKECVEVIENNPTKNIFIAIREPFEIDKLKRRFPNEIQTVLIDRTNYNSDEFISPDILQNKPLDITKCCELLRYDFYNVNKNDEFFDRIEKIGSAYEQGYFDSNDKIAGNNTINEIEYDIVVRNDGTLKEFEENIKELIKIL